MSAHDMTCAMIEACSEVLHSHLGLTVKTDVPKVQPTPNTEYFVTSVIPLAGDLQGVVSLGMPPETAISLAELMLEGRPTAVGKDTTDAVGELTNLIVGVGRRIFARKSAINVSMGLPTVMYGRGKSLRVPAEARSIHFSFTSSIGPMTLVNAIVAAPNSSRISAFGADGQSLISPAELAQSLRSRFGKSKALPIRVSLTEPEEQVAAALIAVTESEMTVIVDKAISARELEP